MSSHLLPNLGQRPLHGFLKVADNLHVFSWNFLFRSPLLHCFSCLLSKGQPHKTMSRYQNGFIIWEASSQHLISGSLVPC